MTFSNQSFAIGKYLIFFCLTLNTLQATTTFTINTNVIFDSTSGDEFSWLNNNSEVTGSGTPFTIIIEEGVEWNIHAAIFDTGNLGSETMIIIEGENSYPNGGQLVFTDNGAKLKIHGTDAIYVSTNNTNGIEALTHIGHVKIETDCEEYKGNELGNIIALGGVTGNCSPIAQGIQLPVEWVYFTAQLREQQTLLKWETASELNNDRFVVEHSGNGIHFTAVGDVMGAGTTNTNNTYYFTHKNPTPGINYYRIKQVDFDGKEDRTQIATVNVKGEEQMPSIRISSNYLSIEQIGEEFFPATAFIFDVAGKQMAQFEITPDQTTTFDISGFADGIYVVAMKNGSTNFSERFFKP